MNIITIIFDGLRRRKIRPALVITGITILEAKTGLICQASGCWVMLTDGTNQLLAQFYSFTVRPPKGSSLRVQGVLKTQNKVPYLATEGLEIVR
jgi:hypothetical protein